MPLVWVKSPLFTWSVSPTGERVKVYHVFKDDDLENGWMREYWYVLGPYQGEESDDCFDIRELPGWSAEHENDKAAFIRAKIREGALPIVESEDDSE